MSPSPRVEAGPVRTGPDRAGALDALLRDLGPRLHRGDRPREAPPARVPTGLEDLDRLLGGGFARGRLSEIAGPVSSGRTSVALALLAQVTQAQEVGALVDVADAFDAASAECAGVGLERVLWVRPPGLGEALRSTERLLEVGGFGLVLLDLAAPGLRVAPPVWPRLARAAAASQAALIALSSQRATGTAADLAVEMKPPQVHFGGTPAVLEELEIQVDLVRHRALPAQRSACLRLRPRAAA